MKSGAMAVSTADALVHMASKVARMGAWRVDLPACRITWSAEVRAIHEVASDFVPTLDSALEFFAEGDRETLRAAFEACARRGEPYDLELELITARSRRIWVRAISEAVRDESGAICAVQGAILDVTAARFAAEKHARLSNKLLATLENMTDAFLMVDRAWQVVYVNREAQRLLQRTAAELVGRNLWKTFSDAIGTVFDHEYHRAMAENVAVAFVEFYAPLDGWFDVKAYPSDEGLAVYFRDVTEKVQNETKLREQAALLDQANDAIVVRDLDERIRYINRSAERLYGWTSAEALGRRGVELMCAADPAEYERAMKRVRETGEWSGHINQVGRDGTAIAAESRWTLVSDRQGRPYAILSVNRDVRERLALEERLAEAGHLEALGRLTGGIAHDFNNLLAVIIGNAELLAEALSSDNETAALAESVLAAAERGSQLTSRLLAFARRQPLAPEIIDPMRVVAGMRGLLRQALGTSIELEIRHGASTWPCYADRVQLESALLNLCINSRDAMPRGGRIVIELHNCDELPPGLRDGETSGGPHVYIAVRDTGHGMSREVAARAFDPFFTTKEKGQGTGLGLSMVYGFVKQSGGQVRVQSAPGQGTCVELYLPRAAAQPRATEAQRAIDEDVCGSEAILVVEDDQALRSYATRVLRRLGYRVESAAEPAEALAKLGGKTVFDLLFTDILMPGGMTGFELAREARRRFPLLRVLYTSGHVGVVEHGAEAPRAAELLLKPYRRNVLAKKVRDVLHTG